MNREDYQVQFVYEYVRTALWSSVDDEGEPLYDSFDIRDLAKEALDTVRQDCLDFIDENWSLLESLNPWVAGHDFWLTRNGHGAGFWDRGLGEVGDKLTKASKDAGACDLYVGDDGLLYIV